MRHAKFVLACLLTLPLIALFAGCGSTESGSFTLTANPSVTVAQGQSQTLTVTPNSSNSFKGSVAVSVSGLPSGVTVSPATATINAGSSTSFTLSAASTAAVGSSTVTVKGVSGSLSANTSVALSVTASGPASPKDFTLTAAPSTLTLTPGASAPVTLNSTAIAGFAGTVAVAVNGLPTGVTVSPSTIAVTPGNPLAITLTAASTITATATPVQVSFVGTSGTLSHTATLQLSLNVVADFSITATPASMTVAQGTQSGLVQIGVTGSNGFTGDVAFTVSGMPAGVTAVPQSSTLQIGESEPIVFMAENSAALGNATVTITGTAGVLTHTATVRLSVVNPPPPDVISLSLSPASETITVGSFGTVAVTASAPSTYTGTVNVTLQNLPVGVIASPTSMALVPGVPQNFVLIATANTQPATSTVTFFGQVNSVNGTADLNLTVVNPTSPGLDVPTWHYDAGRTGLYASETSLTPSSVTAVKFGKVSSVTTDGAVDAQPLFLSGITIGAQTHNILYTATENGTVYAYDAGTGAVIWHTSALGANETAADDQGCSEVSPKVGITATPVIDRNAQPDGAIFFVAKTKDSAGSYHQRLHALNLKTGAELSGSPTEIAATYPANGGTANTFDPGKSVERAALLLNNGTLYLSWAAPCQQTSFDYDGWVMAYSEATLQQQSVLDLTPNGSGGGIWMSGAGPAADADGNVFLITSKGTFDTTLNAAGKPQNGNYGNGYLKIQTADGTMSVFDYFEPLNGVPGGTNYQDQGSGGILLAPAVVNISQAVPALAIGAGKDGNIYELASSGNLLGGYDGSKDNNYATVTGALPSGATSSPAYFNSFLYYGGSGDSLKAFTVSGSGTTKSSQSSSTLGAAGATPVISANGTDTAILWALDTTASGGPVLHAYDATDLTTELYNSTQAQSNGAPRDLISTTGKYAVPVVVNGHVYIGTQSGVDVFGLLVP